MNKLFEKGKLSNFYTSNSGLIVLVFVEVTTLAILLSTSHSPTNKIILESGRQ